MASIAFTDASGSVTLTNGKPGVAGRFRDWELLTDMAGAKRHGPGMNAPATFILREHYGARFTLPYIPAADFALLDRLKRHLEYRGGSCVITTDDAAARVYASCFVWPGGEITWSVDTVEQEVTLQMAVANRAASPAPMLCVY